MFLSNNLISNFSSSFFLATLDIKIKYRRTYLGPQELFNNIVHIVNNINCMGLSSEK